MSEYRKRSSSEIKGTFREYARAENAVDRRNQRMLTVSSSYGRVGNGKLDRLDRNSKALGSIFSVIVFLLIVVALFWNLSGRTSFPTLQSFLEMLQDVPTISTDWISFISFNLDLPDWLGWLNAILDFLEGIVQLGSFVIVGLLNVVPFIVYFLKWIFL